MNLNPGERSRQRNQNQTDRRQKNVNLLLERSNHSERQATSGRQQVAKNAQNRHARLREGTWQRRRPAVRSAAYTARQPAHGNKLNQPHAPSFHPANRRRRQRCSGSEERQMARYIAMRAAAGEPRRRTRPAWCAGVPVWQARQVKDSSVKGCANRTSMCAFRFRR